MNTLLRRVPSGLLLLGLLAPVTRAQWTNDALQNTALVENPSDQNQPKLGPTADGGAWLAWFDGIASGWDVRVQKLAADGTRAFAAPGLLVFDRSLSSTQDYGLAVATNGDALLAFRGSNGNGVVAQRVTAAGALAWGGGVFVTNGSAVIPKIAATSDGGAVVTWGENGALVAQKLDAAGVAQWGSGITIAPSGGAYYPADAHGAGTGAILSIVHQTGGFGSPIHLLAQKLDGAGAPLWGATPVPVFDNGSLQIGNFPSFVPDGAGGAVFAWYSSAPSLQCRAQRLDASGAELWAHNGLALASNGSQLRVTPDASFDPVSGDTFVFWTETDSNQNQRGISGQRVNTAGTLLWGAAGATVVPLGSADQQMARALHGGQTGGAWAVWADIPSFGADQLFAAHVDASGAVDLGPVAVASQPSGKSRLAAARPLTGASHAFLVWSDDRTDGGDLYGQNLNVDGSLGNLVGTKYCGPAVANSTGVPGELHATGSAVVAANDLTLVATQLPEGKFAYELASLTQGFVSTPPGSQGNLCLGGQIARFIAQVGSVAGGTYAIDVDLTHIPMSPPVAVQPGETWNFQCWYRDTNPTGTSNFTDGVSVMFL